MKKYDTIIAGGGPSGMTAALCCAKEGQRVLLIDRCDRVGRKILVTGNGRCNLTNMYQEADCYRGEAPEQMKRVLSSFGLADALTFFHRLGICTRDKNGYIYPYNEQAASVREAFESALLARKNLDILTETSVTGMENTKEGFVVDTEDAGDKPSRKQDNRISRHKKQRFYCRSLIIATGGFAGVKLGCDGSGYEIAGKLGHHIIKPLPALTALRSSAPFMKKLSGVRNQAVLTLLVEEQECAREQGELQWTDYGVSGVAVFQLSRFAILALEEGKRVRLSLDFLPEKTEEETVELLRELSRCCGYKTGTELLDGILPAKLTPVLLQEAAVDEKKKTSRWDEKEIRRLASALKAFSLRISGYVGYEKAQVTRGGVDLRELTGQLESVICPGLFFAGEVLDVDGTCGGYNLQWAFSSGSVAGKAAYERNRRMDSEGIV